MQKILTLVVALMLLPAFSGCLEAEDKDIIEEPGIFDFGRDIQTTWYHYSGGINALEISNSNLSGANIPFWTQGSYYGIGLTTFEPTMGITSNDNLP